MDWASQQGKCNLWGVPRVSCHSRAGKLAGSARQQPHHQDTQYLDKKTRLVTTTKGQPHVRQVWDQVRGTRQAARAWAPAQPPDKQGKLRNRIFTAQSHLPDTHTQPGLATSTDSPNHCCRAFKQSQPYKIVQLLEITNQNHAGVQLTISLSQSIVTVTNTLTLDSYG